MICGCDTVVCGCDIVICGCDTVICGYDIVLYAAIDSEDGGNVLL